MINSVLAGKYFVNEILFNRALSVETAAQIMDDFVPWKVVLVGDGRKTFLHAVHGQQDFFGPMAEESTLDLLAVPNGAELILTVAQNAQAVHKASFTQDAKLLTDSTSADVGCGVKFVRCQGARVDQQHAVNPSCGFRESPWFEDFGPFLNQEVGCG